MPALWRTSIRRTQTLIIMLTSGLALLLACAVFVTYDTLSLRDAMIARMTILADVVGANCAAAIDFDDQKGAREILAALRAEDDIRAACVYTRDGHVFATYSRMDASPLAPADVVDVQDVPQVRGESQEFSQSEFRLYRSIQQKGQQVGTIFVGVDLKDLATRLRRYIGIAGFVLLAAMLAALALSSRLQRFVSVPILRLASLARSVAVERNYSVRAIKESDDELGQLVDGFNEMLEQIQSRDTALENARVDREKSAAERIQEVEAIHRQLVDASRRSGMAEIASNVLHNVGNVLNSVNISAGLIAERIKKSRVSSLGRVVAILGEHAGDLGTFMTNDSAGRLVPDHLARLSDHLLADQEIVVQEVDSLRRNVQHIKEIVAMQQTYATVGGVKEVVGIVDLVEDSMHMNEVSLSRHGVEVIREFEDVPQLNVEKHKVLQILVNLVRNAKHACDDSGRSDKRVTVRVTNGNGRVRISVIDNGVGILPENLTRIFNHGFTTRKGGHGFGLHSGALAAAEMGGSLTAWSDGPGRGAAFTLELPGPQADVAA